ncbi:capsular associated protein [Moelleriella libera RCEF 2490]|uniref:Capsular associated protein n=1 Tax=Moelleriella libera RCEF 2490 TaxID=1081109 RepID=A0A167Y2H3_9HYPO|nr:capsular associated protein [Moelleriella libera RCEF 2490]
MSSTSIAAVWLISSALADPGDRILVLNKFNFLDGLVDSLALFLLSVTSSVWVWRDSPITPVIMVTSLMGISQAIRNILSLGDWLHLSRLSSLLPLWFSSLGLGLFVYAHELRCIFCVGRPFIILSIFLLLAWGTTFTFLRPPNGFDHRHPVNDLIYEARVIHDRWMIKATTSDSLDTAVTVYRERHEGRKPPPNFDVWYEIARKSAVVDEFPQIDRDLSVFWTLTPAALRKQAELATSYPGVGSITLKNGEVTLSGLADEDNNTNVIETLDRIRKFSRFLPDMTLPINMAQIPRVIPSWAHKQRHGQASLHHRAKTRPRRPVAQSPHTDHNLRARSGDGGRNENWNRQRAAHLQQTYLDACPPDSLARLSSHWEIGSFCSVCAEPHSLGQFTSDWMTSLNTCNQPDLGYLHSFFTRSPSLPPIKEVMPLFGSFKTTGFLDILLPVLPPQQTQLSDELPFHERKESLFWRSAIGMDASKEQTIRTSQKMRLLRLIKNPSAHDKIAVVLPMTGSDHFKTQLAPAREVNRDLSFDVGVENSSACVSPNCNFVRNTWGIEEWQDPHQYRYVLLTDEDDGPPTNFLATLRSRSLPLLSTIFQTWYSDRLTPWLHFVPIDIRFHALHTSLLYFTGTASRAKMNGINSYVQGRPQDAEWIAQQGQRWASRALGSIDIEVYLFRLLLEWGRLIDDRRDEIGFWKDNTNQYQNDGWSQQPDHSIS